MREDRRKAGERKDRAQGHTPTIPSFRRLRQEDMGSKPARLDGESLSQKKARE